MNLSYIPENELVSEFYRWKKARKKNITLIGPKLLPLEEPDLITVLNFWENTAQKCLQTDQPSTILVGCLYLAVFFYFHRSISRINKFIPRISQLVVHQNRCITKTASNLLFFISYQSRESINFFHDFLSESWLEFDINSPLNYPSLIVLGESFYLAPALVRSFVTPNFDSIVSLCFVNDFDVQDAALQVVYHHVDVSDGTDFRTNLFEICYSHLKPEPSRSNRGALFIARMLVKMNLTVDQTNSLILMITTFLTLQDEMVLNLCAEILFAIFDQGNVHISLHLMKNLTNSMFKTIQRRPDSITLFNLFNKILGLTPQEIFPKNVILDFVNEIFTKQKISQRYGYSLLLNILKRDPQTSVLFKVPLDKNLCKEYRALLKIQPRFIFESQKKLREIVENGLKQNSNDELIITLKVLRASYSMLWSTSEEIINRISHLRLSVCDAVRLETVRILGKFKNQNLLKLLVESALFDSSHKVRKAAINSLFIQKDITVYNLLPNILNDDSIENVFLFIDLMDKIYETNPIIFAPSSLTFCKKIISNYLKRQNLKDSTMVSSLFPKFSSILPRIDDNISRLVASFVIYVLMRGETSAPPLLSDIYQNKKILKPFDDSIETEKSIKKTIFRLVHMPLLDKCDIDFMKSLELLKDKADYSQIIPLFKTFLKERRKHEVTEVALTTLRSFIPYIGLPLDDELTVILFEVLNHTSFSIVAKADFKLFGTAGICHLPNTVLRVTETLPKLIAEYSPKFIHLEIFKSLCNLVPTQLPSFFSVATSAILLYPDEAAEFMSVLIPQFIRVLSISKNDSVLMQLMSITKKMSNFMEPYLDALQPLLIEKMDDELWVHFCRVLSISLKDNFIPYSPFLYHKSVSIVPSITLVSLVKQHLKFLSASVVMQHQPISVFLGLCESLVKSTTTLSRIVIHELIRVLQNYDDVRQFSSWFVRIFVLIHKNAESMQLMYSIAFFGNISTNLLLEILDSVGMAADQNLLKIVKIEKSRENVPSFMIVKKIRVKEIEPSITESLSSSEFVDRLLPPINKNIDKWVQDFVQDLVSYSPSRGIRACRELVSQSEAFRNNILPAAFLSCWHVTPEDQRIKIIDVFHLIVEHFHPLPQSLWRLLDILATCHISFPLPFEHLAKASIFPAQTLYYLKCDFIQTKNNVEPFLEQLLKLGQIDTARGVLTISKNKVKNVEKWSERLGDWKEALNMYKSEDVVDLIRCYGNLEDWDNILLYESKFDEMSVKDKEQCSVWFGWAFYFLGNIEKAESYIKYFPQHLSQHQFFFQSFIKIIHDDFDSVTKMIEEAFTFISNDHSMFDGSNVKLAEERLAFSQQLIEISEVVEFKKNKNQNVNPNLNLYLNQTNDQSQNYPILWDYRKPLNERSADIRELTNIRSLLFSKEQKLKMSIKMASLLRKGRQLNGLKSAFCRMIRIGQTPEVFFEGIKMLWFKNEKFNAITFLSILVTAYSNAASQSCSASNSSLNTILSTSNSITDDFDSASTSNSSSISKSKSKRFLRTNPLINRYPLRKETKVFTKDLNKLINDDYDMDDMTYNNDHNAGNSDSDSDFIDEDVMPVKGRGFNNLNSNDLNNENNISQNFNKFNNLNNMSEGGKFLNNLNNLNTFEGISKLSKVSEDSNVSSKLRSYYNSLDTKSFKFIAFAADNDGKVPNDPSILAERTIKYAKENPVSETFLAKAKRILTIWKLQEEPQTLHSLVEHCEILRDCYSKLQYDVKTISSLALCENTIIERASANIESDNDNKYNTNSDNINHNLTIDGNNDNDNDKVNTIDRDNSFDNALMNNPTNINVLSSKNSKYNPKTIFTQNSESINIDEYALDCTEHFLKVINMSSQLKLSTLLLLLNLLSRCATDYLMKDRIVTALKNLPSSLISQAFPQLANLLSHKCEKLREAVRQIFLNYGKANYESVFYTMMVSRLSNDKLKAKMSDEIFQTLQVQFSHMTIDLLAFTNNLQNASISILEYWKSGIEKAKRNHEKQNEEAAIQILKDLIFRLDHPICDLDRNLRKIIEVALEDFRDIFAEYINLNLDDENDQYTQKIQNALWSRLFYIHDQISNKINQLAIINLPTVAPDLATQKNLSITVPGTNHSVRILSFDPTLKVLRTAIHPRFLTIIGDDGKEYHFLLKGNCDVRIDYRIMQFFVLLNSILASCYATSNLSITRLTILPLSFNSGLISWVENSESLYQIISSFKSNREKESDLFRNYFGTAGSSMTKIQVYEVYETIAQQTTADEIDQYIWLKSETSSIWLKNNTTFVTSTALASIAGYIIGLGDRHPNNILIQSHNGKIAHIDFEHPFEVTMTRIAYPEKVPFRFTRMIVNALDGSTPFGMFRKTCEDVLSLLRDAKQTLFAQIQFFATDTTIFHNPLFEGAKIFERVKEKVEGKDIFLLKDETESVEKQVEKLIDVSSDPQLYGTQFIGWCPYW